MRPVTWVIALMLGPASLVATPGASAQVPPSAEQAARYSGLHAAAQCGDMARLEQGIAAGPDLGDLKNDRHNAVTIAAVADDEETLRVLLLLGASATLVTSRYGGTVLIEAIVLGRGGARR
jgi:ankyrin repeat protein